jgi:hypothetical protein
MARSLPTVRSHGTCDAAQVCWVGPFLGAAGTVLTVKAILRISSRLQVRFVVGSQPHSTIVHGIHIDGYADRGYEATTVILPHDATAVDKMDPSVPISFQLLDANDIVVDTIPLGRFTYEDYIHPAPIEFSASPIPPETQLPHSSLSLSSTLDLSVPLPAPDAVVSSFHGQWLSSPPMYSSPPEYSSPPSYTSPLSYPSPLYLADEYESDDGVTGTYNAPSYSLDATGALLTPSDGRAFDPSTGAVLVDTAALYTIDSAWSPTQSISALSVPYDELGRTTEAYNRTPLASIGQLTPRHSLNTTCSPQSLLADTYACQAGILIPSPSTEAATTFVDVLDNLEEITQGWSPAERTSGRRLVHFMVASSKVHGRVTVKCKPITERQYTALSSHETVISCLYWPERSEDFPECNEHTSGHSMYCITSVGELLL